MSGAWISTVSGAELSPAVIVTLALHLGHRDGDRRATIDHGMFAEEDDLTGGGGGEGHMAGYNR